MTVETKTRINSKIKTVKTGLADKMQQYANSEGFYSVKRNASLQNLLCYLYIYRICDYRYIS